MFYALAYDAFRKRYPEVEVVASSVITLGGRVYSSGGGKLTLEPVTYLLENWPTAE